MVGTPVGIVAGRALVRAGLRALLEQDQRVAVVGDAGTMEDAVALARTLSAGVMLVDLTSEGLDGVAVTRDIVRRSAARVLLLTASERDERLMAAVLAGAGGVVIEAVPLHELVRAVHAVARGVALVPHNP
jgi:DNA-binding NarL/FixJ family response regulator